MLLPTSRIIPSRMLLGALCSLVTTACRQPIAEHYGSYWDASLDAPCDSVPHDSAPSDSTMPVQPRRALAVITDFADTTLEAWTGPGFNSVAEVQA